MVVLPLLPINRSLTVFMATVLPLAGAAVKNVSTI